MMTTRPQENLLSSSAVWSRCRVYKLGWSRCDLWCLLQYAPCLNMTLFLRSCNATAQIDLKASSPLMRGVAATFDCMGGALETCTQMFDHDGHRWSTCRPFCCSKKDGHQRLIFDNREASHNFAPPPYTPLAARVGRHFGCHRVRHFSRPRGY